MALASCRGTKSADKEVKPKQEDLTPTEDLFLTDEEDYPPLVEDDYEEPDDEPEEPPEPDDE